MKKKSKTSTVAAKKAVAVKKTTTTAAKKTTTAKSTKAVATKPVSAKKTTKVEPNILRDMTEEELDRFTYETFGHIKPISPAEYFSKLK